MRVAVCVKAVPSTTEVRMDPVTNTIVRDGCSAVLNPFDTAALEVALQLKERMGAQVATLSMGIPATEALLRDTIARGADTALLLSDRAFAGADTLATSYALSLGLAHLDEVFAASECEGEGGAACGAEAFAAGERETTREGGAAKASAKAGAATSTVQATAATSAQKAGARQVAAPRAAMDQHASPVPFDLLLCGKMAVDGDTAQIGPELAALFDIPCVAGVTRIVDASDRYLTVAHETDEGTEVVEVPLPAVLTVAKDIATLRMPSISGVLASQDAHVTMLNAQAAQADLSRCGLTGSPTQVVRSFVPERSHEAAEVAGTLGEQASALLDIFEEAGR